MAALGGLMGIPFAQNFFNLLQGLANQAGLDFDPKEKARELILDLGSGKIDPDLVMHGAGRYSFGIPAIADLTAELFGVKTPDIPRFDMSRAVGMGDPLPIDPGKLLIPRKDVAENEVRTLQRASGAYFGLGFELYNFLNSRPIAEPDQKKWEKVMPRVLANLSAASRYMNEGKERDKKGAAVVRFDPYDTPGMVETIARAMGFQSTRLMQRQENLQAKYEAIQYWDIRRETIMHQYYAAWKSNDPEKVKSVRDAVERFNNEVPQELAGKKLTGNQIAVSIRNREMGITKTELGYPQRPQDMGVYKRIDRLYPNGARPPGLVDVQKVQ
jgi:hypothetical protein